MHSGNKCIFNTFISNTIVTGVRDKIDLHLFWGDCGQRGSPMSLRPHFPSSLSSPAPSLSVATFPPCWSMSPASPPPCTHLPDPTDTRDSDHRAESSAVPPGEEVMALFGFLLFTPSLERDRKSLGTTGQSRSEQLSPRTSHRAGRAQDRS